MQVKNGFFKVLDPGSAPGFVLRVYARGSDFEKRAPPLRARVGNVVVERLHTASDGSGFSGYLAQTPNDGDRLFVRYADEEELATPVVFGPDLVG